MDKQRITDEIGSYNGKAVNIKVAKFSFDDKLGSKKYVAEIVVEQLILLAKKD